MLITRFTLLAAGGRDAAVAVDLAANAQCRYRWHPTAMMPMHSVAYLVMKHSSLMSMEWDCSRMQPKEHRWYLIQVRSAAIHRTRMLSRIQNSVLTFRLRRRQYLLDVIRNASKRAPVAVTLSETRQEYDDNILLLCDNAVVSNVCYCMRVIWGISKCLCTWMCGCRYDSLELEVAWANLSSSLWKQLIYVHHCEQQILLCNFDMHFYSALDLFGCLSVMVYSFY